MSEDGFRLQIAPRNNGTKVYRNKGETVGRLVLGVVFFGGSGLLLHNIVGANPQLLYKEYLVWAGCLLMAFLMIPMVIRLFDSRPAMEFSDHGAVIRDMSEETIPWAAITRVSLRSYRRVTFLEIEIDQRAAQDMRLTRWHRVLGVGNRMLGLRHHVINTQSLTHSAEFLARLMNFYMEKSRANDA